MEVVAKGLGDSGLCQVAAACGLGTCGSEARRNTRARRGHRGVRSCGVKRRARWARPSHPQHPCHGPNRRGVARVRFEPS